MLASRGSPGVPGEETPGTPAGVAGYLNSAAFSEVTTAVPVSTFGFTVSPLTAFQAVSTPSSPILAGNCAMLASSVPGHLI